MEEIIKVHFQNLEDHLVKQALAAFYWLRRLNHIEKKPSTSELVDWLRALVVGGVDSDRITKNIPFAGVLLKKRQGSTDLAECRSVIDYVCCILLLAAAARLACLLK